MRKAIQRVLIRILLFYICVIIIIGMLVSSSDPRLNLNDTAAGSPFVLAIENAGVAVLPHIIIA
jgi:yeast amino acid transporter